MMPVEAFLRQDAEAVRPAPALVKRGWRKLLFGDVASSLLTVLISLCALWAVPRVLDWAVFDAVWRGNGQACFDAGACWAFLGAKWPLILFGIYPPDQQWRPIVVVLAFLAITLWSLPERNWTRATATGWLVVIVSSLLLMGGDTLGLQPVPTGDWGGLPITILLTVLSLTIGFPFGILLALGRRSEDRMMRWLSVGFIEIVRGLPLLTMLFIAAILLPLMLPDGVTFDNLSRALVALTFYSAAYLAEVIRGGLQSLPKGQEEAARALGLGRLATLRFIILPQAIHAVIPPLTNTVVVVVKNTSLVLVVGLFDLLSAGRSALTDPDWPSPYIETYILVGFVYFVICFGISRYSLWLEHKLSAGVQR
ncbi:amino acid ABC transporter permease [Novosphingobium indicum]|uniref:Amino acid ABC transporter permease n=1 Tax=Novosphingobium indicum TaxID=462949 RepID=A0ABQ2K0M3_9SPHN|nr:amino acid ABC transporter permease [Novosphingobium indicum]GGN61546.1 amino acid ABC transporter permease [Novosphingobium indicum]